MSPTAGASRTPAVSPESGSNFRLGFLFLPKPRREALSAVYGFCRYVDDIVDSGAQPPEEAAKQLEFWRGEIEALYAGSPTHPISRGLAPYVRQYDLPKEGFLELIRGVGMDLAKSRYETFEELKAYLFGVAGAVGLLCVEIFGHRHTPPADLREYAIQMGNAFQLTNILRDVGADLELGRIYLPLEDLKAAGYTEKAFIERRHSPEFLRLMNMEYARAKEFYSRARNSLHPADRPSMVPAEVMAGIYEAVLDEMKARNFRVFFERVSLSPWRKATIACKAWLHSRGIY